MSISDEVLVVAQRHLKRIRRSGPDNIMAICPFHRKDDGTDEKTPSFAMSLSKGLYFCHSCESKGNLFTFLKKAAGLDSGTIEVAYKSLLDGVARNIPPPPNPLDPKVISLNPLPEGILGIFDQTPDALLDKGFTEETLQEFEVGFDDVHFRITYPLRDLSGQLVGISGRTVTGAHPRYKIYDREYSRWNLPERLNWDKRIVLWNAHTFYPEVYLRTAGIEVVVVEGFNACMWLVQSGIKQTVALLGTYLSYEQQWVLERMGGTVYLFLDNNQPGWTGTIKAAEKLIRSLPVKIMRYPIRLRSNDEAQPDNLTLGEVVEAKEGAIDYVKWLSLGEGE